MKIHWSELASIDFVSVSGSVLSDVAAAERNGSRPPARLTWISQFNSIQFSSAQLNSTQLDPNERSIIIAGVGFTRRSPPDLWFRYDNKHEWTGLKLVTHYGGQVRSVPAPGICIPTNCLSFARSLAYSIINGWIDISPLASSGDQVVVFSSGELSIEPHASQTVQLNDALMGILWLLALWGQQPIEVSLN